VLTIGAEEEFFIVNPKSRKLAQAGLPGLHHLMENGVGGPEPAGYDNEFQLPIVESRTGICGSLADLQSNLIRLRQALIAAAESESLAVAASGTLPTAQWRDVAVTDKFRYHRIAEQYHDVVKRRLTCGYHVHIGISDPDVRVLVLNRVQMWLPVLLAFSASSPFFGSRNTGYASYRHTLWGGFPVAGPAPRFDNYEQYTRYIEMLIGTGAILDAGHIYWDVRLGTRFPTLEFRIADACPSVDSAVLQAGLCRALVLTCLREIERGEPAAEVDRVLLRAANWHAGRWGLSGNLIDVAARQEVPAAELTERMLRHLGDALTDLGDYETVRALALQTLNTGSSAARQQALHAVSGSIDEVTDWLIEQTRTGQMTAAV
jgi:glutamate---cysteine ligase / carboxylate-amine ligase